MAKNPYSLTVQITKRQSCFRAELKWPKGFDHSEDVFNSLQALAKMPGVYLQEQSISLPSNVFWTEAATALLELLALPAPQTSAPLQQIQIWQPKRKLFQHQLDALPFLLRAERALLADDMGLAKSSTGIAFAMSVATFFERPVIIVAKKQLQSNWVRELTLAGAITSPSEVVTIEGKDSKQPYDKTKRFYIINPELIRDWWSELSKLHACVALFDEAHAYKDRDTSRSIGASMLAMVPYVLLLTGSPIPNRPEELFPLLEILQKNMFGSKTAYMTRYCGAYIDKYGLHATGATNTGELLERMRGFYLRRTLADTNVVLPKLTRNLVKVQWEDQHLRGNYDAMLRSAPDLVDSIVNGKAGKRTLEALTALRKMTSEAKLPATIKRAVELQKAGKSVVIFTWQKVTATYLCKKIAAQVCGTAPDGTRGVYAITGELNLNVRTQIVDVFQQLGGVIVSTYETLAEGVTLTKSSNIILHDLHWVPKDILQAERRIHRIGQTVDCEIDWMVVEQSVDELLAVALGKKLADMAQMVGGTEELEEIVSAVGSGEKVLADELETMLASWVSSGV